MRNSSVQRFGRKDLQRFVVIRKELWKFGRDGKKKSKDLAVTEKELW